MQNTEFNRLKLKTDQLYLPLSGGKVNGETTFSKRVTVGSGKKEITINDGVIEGNDGSYLPITLEELEEGTSDVPKTVKANLLKNALLNCANPVGTIIHSTTCDTMAKVIEAYGGTTWIQHEGYILRGAASNVTANDNSNSGTGFGGSDTVTLTGAQSGLKGHGHGFTQPTVNGGATNTGWISADHTHNAWLEYGATGISSYPPRNDHTTTPSYKQFGHIGPYSNQLSGVTANHYHSQVAHTHSVSGGAVSDAGASNASSSHSVVQRYKNIYIWERTA